MERKAVETMTYFLLLSLVCGILILLIATITKILGNRLGRKWRYILWLVLAVRMLVPVDISIPTPVFTVELPQVEVSQPVEEEDHATVVKPQTGTVTGTPSMENSVPTTNPGTTSPLPSPSQPTPDITPPVTEPAPSWDWSLILAQIWNALPWIWLAGALFSGAWFIGGYHYQRNTMLRWSYVPQDQKLQDQFAYYCTQLTIGQPVDLRICKCISSPMMVGLLKPVLLMPEGTYGERELEYIFRHELLHIQRRDIWAKSLMILVRIIHWFNPATILMSQEMGEDIEILCDGQVVQDMDEQQRREYNEVLLQYLAHRREESMAFSTCFGSRMQKLKDRFVQVRRSGKLKKGYIITAVLLVMVLTGTFLISCGTQSKEQDGGGKEESVGEESSDEESSKIVDEEAIAMAQAYLEIVEEIIEEYGEFGIVDVSKEKTVSGKMLNGAVRFYDFNMDGKSELFCSYNLDELGEYAIYEYKDGKATVIQNGIVGYSDEEGGFVSHFIMVDEAVYLNISGKDSSQFPKFIGWDGKEWSTFLEYDDSTERIGGSKILNGEVLSANEFAGKMNHLLSNGRSQKIYYGRPTPISVEYTVKAMEALEETIEKGRWVSSQDPAWYSIDTYKLEGTPSDEEGRGAQEYMLVIQSLWDQGYETYLYRLFDFDNDGRYELYCTYEKDDELYQSIYQWNGTEIQAVFQDTVWKNDVGNDATWIRRNADGVYLHNGEDATDWTIRDGEWIQVRITDFDQEQMIDYSEPLDGWEKGINAEVLTSLEYVQKGWFERWGDSWLSEPIDAGWSSNISERATVGEAYLPVVEQLRQTYGEGYVDTVYGENILRGLGMVWLVDFDRDGFAELYCAYETPGSGIINQEEIYQYQDGEAVMIYQGPVNNNVFVYQEKEEYTQYCIRDKDTLDGADPVCEARILVDGQMQTIIRWELDKDTDTVLVNGEEMDRNSAMEMIFPYFGQWFNTYIFHFVGDKVEGPYYHYIFS